MADETGLAASVVLSNQVESVPQIVPVSALQQNTSASDALLGQLYIFPTRHSKCYITRTGVIGDPQACGIYSRSPIKTNKNDKETEVSIPRTRASPGLSWAQAQVGPCKGVLFQDLFKC